MTIESAGFQVVGWTLLHSLWQCGLAWACNRLLRRACRRYTANLRYLVACTLLAGAMASVVITFAVLQADPTAGVAPAVGANGRLQLIRLNVPPAWWVNVSGWARDAMPWLVTAWSVTAAVLLGRLLVGFVRVNTLHGSFEPIPATLHPEGVTRLLQAFGIRRTVTLFETRALHSPATVGWLRPAIFVPVGFLSGTAPAVVECVIAHELAHIRQHDYLVGCVQLAVQAAFWFNPAVHLLNRDIRQIREECADALAVGVSKCGRRAYALALVEVAKAAHRPPPALAIGMATSSFERRIDSILSTRVSSGVLVILQAVALCSGALIALASGGGSAATAVEQRVLIAGGFAEPLSDQIYDVLGANRPNREFASAVEQAHVQLRSGHFNQHDALKLADAVNRGGRPDELLRAAEPSLSVRSLRVDGNSAWSGGGSREWERLAEQVMRLAMDASDRSAKMKLARAGLLVASQSKLYSGGVVQVMLRSPEFLDAVGINNKDRERMLIALSAETRAYEALGAELDAWRTGRSVSIPTQLLDAAASRPAIQWLIANQIWQVTRDEPSRAEQLIASARAHGRVDLTLSLLGRR